MILNLCFDFYFLHLMPSWEFIFWATQEPTLGSAILGYPRAFLGKWLVGCPRGTLPPGKLMCSLSLGYICMKSKRVWDMLKPQYTLLSLTLRITFCYSSFGFEIYILLDLWKTLGSLRATPESLPTGWTVVVVSLGVIAGASRVEGQSRF